VASCFSGGTDPPPSGLSIAVAHGNGAPVLRVAGELDLTSAPRLRQAVNTVLAGHPPVLVVDLSGLGFSDCTGLRVLIEARRRQAARGHQLRITGLQSPVRRLIHLVGFDAHLGLAGPAPVPAPRTDRPG
jgi:anti-sigma B factor antagonist